MPAKAQYLLSLASRLLVLFSVKFSLFRALQCKMHSYGSGRVCSTDAAEYRYQQSPVEWQYSCRSTLLGHTYQWTVLFSWLYLARRLHILWGCMYFTVFNISGVRYFILLKCDIKFTTVILKTVNSVRVIFEIFKLQCGWVFCYKDVALIQWTFSNFCRSLHVNI